MPTSATSTRILLLRHGAIHRPAGTLVGQRDLPLSPLGRDQAMAWRAQLKDVPFTAVYTSPLSRCRETLELVLPGTQIAQLAPRLAEINLGRWEGLDRTAIERVTPGGWEERGKDMPNYRPPGGESFQDVAARALPMLDHIARTAPREGGLVLAVTHFGVIRVLLCHILGLSLDKMADLPVDYASIHVIAVNPGHCSPRLVAQNIAPGGSLPLP